VILSLNINRNGKPDKSLRGFYFVAVAPIAPSILHIVEENKLVNHIDEIEVTLPGNIVGLDDSDFLAHTGKPSIAAA
jgi:hypothetical protein